MSRVEVISTGTANLASVLAGLRRGGAEPVLVDDPARVRSAAGVVLPGVGHFEAARASLGGELGEAVRERVSLGLPTLGICLGMQLCFDGSEEAPGVEGLGLVASRLEAFPRAIRSPHLGWTRVQAAPGARFVRDGFACFAHSFRALSAPAPWRVSLADHGGPFVAAVEWRDILLCQFHPELSGAWGAGLIARWLDAVKGVR